MKRKKPLRSRRQMRPSSRTSKYARRERGIDYMLAVKRLGCCAIIVPGHVCDGPIEADHAGPRGVGKKAHDSTVIPLCKLAHQQRADFSGPFRSWNHAKMHDFLVGRVLWTQRYLGARGITPPPMTDEQAIEFARWLNLRTADEVAAAAPRPRELPLAEDLREEGNVDVRHPDAAPLPVARVVSEGNPR